MAEDQVNRPLDVFHKRIWEKILKQLKSPRDIKNVCNASTYFSELMVENGHHGVALFKDVYPLIRPYLGSEPELLTRDFGIQSPNVFIERAKNFLDDLDDGEFGKLREVCPYWRQVVWKDALQRFKRKYKRHPYPPDYITIPGEIQYLILTPIDGPGPVAALMRNQPRETVWPYARNMLAQARRDNARYRQTGRFLSSLAPHTDNDIAQRLANARSFEELADLLRDGQIAVIDPQNL